MTERLARELDAELVCGCDFCIGMLEQAVIRRSGPWVQSDAQHLRLSWGSVDVVASTESFHWFPDADGALAEFRRVLAPRAGSRWHPMNCQRLATKFAAVVASAPTGRQLLMGPTTEARWLPLPFRGSGVFTHSLPFRARGVHPLAPRTISSSPEPEQATATIARARATMQVSR